MNESVKNTKNLINICFIVMGTMLLFNSKALSQIQGGVIDQKGQGIANALIKATDSDGKIADTVRSDKRGFYMFKGLKPGKYKIQATAPGFLPAIYEDVLAIKEDQGEPSIANDISSAFRLEIKLKPAKTP